MTTRRDVRLVSHSTNICSWWTGLCGEHWYIMMKMTDTVHPFLESLEGEVYK